MYSVKLASPKAPKKMFALFTLFSKGSALPPLDRGPFYFHSLEYTIKLLLGTVSRKSQKIEEFSKIKPPCLYSKFVKQFLRGDRGAHFIGRWGPLVGVGRKSIKLFSLHVNITRVWLSENTTDNLLLSQICKNFVF